MISHILDGWPNMKYNHNNTLRLFKHVALSRDPENENLHFLLEAIDHIHRLTFVLQASQNLLQYSVDQMDKGFEHGEWHKEAVAVLDKIKEVSP